MAPARVSRRGLRAVPRSAAPDGGAVPASLGFSCLAAVNARPGANTVTWGWPVTVCLVREACANFGRAFLGARRVALAAGDIEGVQGGAGGGICRGGERVQG